jgi:hypothetical protein
MTNTIKNYFPLKEAKISDVCNSNPDIKSFVTLVSKYKPNTKIAIIAAIR